ncbi:MAG TPA: hypothetical protein VJN44_15490, partial [Roseateles sp.]|nr:hypothetical protein [Roseateles sp.]
MKFAPLPTVLTLLISAALATSALAQQPTKPATTKPAAGKPPRSRVPAKPVPPSPPPLPDASEEQLEAAGRAHLGLYECEFKQSITIEPYAAKAGYIDVNWQKFKFTMKPVLSSTGALRLEDVAGRTLMIQIGNKSMLMDTHIGQRLVDECIHPAQRAAIEAAKAARAAEEAAGIAPAAGLGIEPKSAAATAAVVAAKQAAAAAAQA